jgi:putative membrane protein
MSANTTPRKPRVIAPEDLHKTEFEDADDDQRHIDDSLEVTGDGAADVGPGPATGSSVRSGMRWGGLFLSAMVGLAGLAASISFAGFVSSVVARDDWIGWLAFALVTIAAVALLAIIVRELFGLYRLGRLTHLSRSIAAAVRAGDVVSEKTAVRKLVATYRQRPDMKWPVSRLRDHIDDVHDSGDLARLAERELMLPLDQDAKRLILRSAKRVSMVTALSPMAWVSMLFVISENLGLLKRLAGLYGGRPGSVGALKMARMVFTHIVATGGVAMTDDLLGQFLGQDLLRRLSRRLGEGVFNGALTARIGAAAVDVVRPLPFTETPKIRVRDIVRQLVRRLPKS